MSIFQIATISHKSLFLQGLLSLNSFLNCLFHIELDANSKLGEMYIPNDPHEMSPNGRILSEAITRYNLKVANGLEICEGVITRKKVRRDRTEESVIDFVIVSEDMVPDIKAIVIDEERKHVLTRVTKAKGVVKTVESDHNPIITELYCTYKRRNSTRRMEMFNLKNQECQKKFREVTNKTNILSRAFRKNEDLNVSANRFIKRLNKIIQSCFKKVRIGKLKVNPRINELFEKRTNLK